MVLSLDITQPHNIDQPFSFIRDNPFIKNDLRMRMRSLSNTLTRQRSDPSPQVSASNGSRSLGLVALPKPPSIEHCGGTTKEFSMGDKRFLEDADKDNLSTGSDIEYGPGIVERLKAKFHRLSGFVSRNSKVSPHTTGKRCPSMDDILSSAEDESGNNRKAKSGNSTINLSSLSRQHSQSTGDMLDDDNERHLFTVHRVVDTRQGDYPETLSISALRRKFEINVQRKPSQNLRHAKGTSTSVRETCSRSISVDLSRHSVSTESHKDGPPPRRFELGKALSNLSQSTEQTQRACRTIVPCHRKYYENLVMDSVSQRMKVFETKRDTTKTDNKKPFRVLEVLNRAAAAELVDNNNDDEPEFIKIGRRLRRNSFYLEELERHREDVHEIQQNVREMPRNEVKKVASCRRLAEVPKLSNNARIVRDHFYEEPNHEIHCFDMESPPDPDSARQRESPTSGSSALMFVRTDDLKPSIDASPPPEEPKPSQDFGVINQVNDCNRKANLSDGRKSVVPQVTPPQIIPKNNDESGVVEMLRLLDKFQRSRDKRRAEKTKAPQTPEMTDDMHSHSHQHSFVHAVVGVRSTHSSNNFRGYSQDAHYSLKTSQPNVVNISVSNSAQEFESHKHDNNNDEDDGDEYASSVLKESSGVKRPASPSPTVCIPSSHPEQTRKSLSARYIEEKLKVVSPHAREQCDDEVIALKHASSTSYEIDPAVSNTSTMSNINNELSSESLRLPFIKSEELISSDTEEVESSRTESFNLFHFENDLIAGDGNPIRHSLLSLVMEEDIPALMEAMNEDFTFEFEDLHEVPSTSSILHPPEMRKLRRKARQISSIRFEETEPKVYTYLDEVSAVVNNEWVEGVHLDYEAYQRIIAAEVEEYKKSMAELQKWKESIAAQVPSKAASHPEDGEFSVDGSSPFTYPTAHNESNTISV